MNVRYTVSLVELFADAVIVVANVAVSAFPVTSPVISPTKAVDVILVAPVTTPASTLIVPSNKIADPDAGSRLIAPPESNVTVVPIASKVPSAVIVILAAAAAASVVVIANVPLEPAVNTAVSLVSPVIVMTLPFTATSSTVKAVNVPKLVIAV